jgi:hypothetical protein
LVVTVGLLIKNGEGYLPSLLESLKSQESKATVCILAIDSGSSDDSFEIVFDHPTPSFIPAATASLNKSGRTWSSRGCGGATRPGPLPPAAAAAPVACEYPKPGSSGSAPHAQWGCTQVLEGIGF